MNAAGTDTVASSWIEALGGLSMCWIFSTPPCFWASAGPPSTNAATAASNATRPLRVLIVSSQRNVDFDAPPTQFTPTVIKNLGRVQALGAGERNGERLDRVERRRGDAGRAREGDRGAHNRFDLH